MAYRVNAERGIIRSNGETSGFVEVRRSVKVKSLEEAKELQVRWCASRESGCDRVSVRQCWKTKPSRWIDTLEA